MIQPVTNDREHELALAEIDRLWASEDAAESAAREALAILVAAYEDKRWPIASTLDPIDMIKHAMSPDVGHTRQELIEIAGSASGASQVLSRMRPLTLDMIRLVSTRWGIPIDLLTPAYRLDGRSRVKVKRAVAANRAQEMGKAGKTKAAALAGKRRRASYCPRKKA